MSVDERKQLFYNYIQNTAEIKAKLKEEHMKKKMKKHERLENTDEDQDKRKRKHFKKEKDKLFNYSQFDLYRK